jgi:glycosyltransferase involved in cell wall biosynthesis
VLFVGPEDPYKGLQVLRAATEELLSRGLPVRVCHVGGPAVYSGDGFIGTGRLTGAALSAAYDNAALLVAPAIYPDPCPTVILEAMAHSLPVVASATGGHADIVTEDTGRLVPVGSSSALANAIETLVRDKDLAAKLGRNGREHCRSFSSDVVIPRIIATYAKVVES